MCVKVNINSFPLQGCSPSKCKVYLNYVMKNFPVPGILCGDYYRLLP